MAYLGELQVGKAAMTGLVVPAVAASSGPASRVVHRRDHRPGPPARPWSRSAPVPHTPADRPQVDTAPRSRTVARCAHRSVDRQRAIEPDATGVAGR